MSTHRSFSAEENPNNHVVTQEFIHSGQDNEMECVTCPHCGGFFAVDSSYLDNVTDVVHCPMCCIETIIDMEEA